MNANGAGHLRQAGDRFFHPVGIDHHKVGQLVDDDDQVGEGLVLFFVHVVEKGERLAFVKCAVVLFDIADAALGQEFQATLHFARGVAHHVGRNFWVGDHWREQVRNVGVQTKFELLWVDQHELQFVRRGFKKHAHQ